MTTAVYNRQSIAGGADIRAYSPISVRIESEAGADEISAFLVTIANALVTAQTTRAAVPAIAPAGRLEDNPYYLNKYGDEYAYVDELGFEASYMGPRADLNHIF